MKTGILECIRGLLFGPRVAYQNSGESCVQKGWKSEIGRIGADKRRRANSCAPAARMQAGLGLSSKPRLLPRSLNFRYSVASDPAAGSLFLWLVEPPPPEAWEVSAAGPKFISEALANFNGNPVLTGGERERFAEDGGFIRFTLADNKVRFENQPGRRRTRRIENQLKAAGAGEERDRRSERRLRWIFSEKRPFNVS